MVIGLCTLLSCYLAEGIAKNDSSTRHEWKTPAGRHHTHTRVRTRAFIPRDSQVNLTHRPVRQHIPTHMQAHTQNKHVPLGWQIQTSILLSMTDVTELFTGNSSYFVTIVQMKDQQQTAELSAEVFGYPLVPERPQTQAVLSWKSSFLSNRASSVTNRRPLLTKWEPARQMSPASLTLSYSPFTSTS